MGRGPQRPRPMLSSRIRYEGKNPTDEVLPLVHRVPSPTMGIEDQIRILPL